MKIPTHIAFIMDGNGRWAKKRLMPRTYGHKIGINALERVAAHCNKLGIKYMSVFAFSTENWKRPKEEVDEIIRLMRGYLKKLTPKKVKKDNIKLMHMGCLETMPVELKTDILEAIERTKECTGLVLNIGFNYGGKLDIVQAVNKWLVGVAPESNPQITSEDISNNLYTKDIPDPDIVVRTSGEKRVSNFMLWQMAYSEFIFITKHWPDMNAKVLEKILVEFSARERRFGNVK
ncbi:MAG: polyprenyl diphosphate synthase [Firmicutes bacterium]|nr:polyprenyl diphosphate synthase [Bacillota bacterium]